MIAMSLSGTLADLGDALTLMSVAFDVRCESTITVDDPFEVFTINANIQEKRS